MLCSVCCFVFVLPSLSCTVSSQWRSRIGTAWRSHNNWVWLLWLKPASVIMWQSCNAKNIFSHVNHLHKQQKCATGSVRLTTLSQLVAAHSSCPTIALCITALHPQYCVNVKVSLCIKGECNSSWKPVLTVCQWLDFSDLDLYSLVCEYTANKPWNPQLKGTETILLNL